MTTSGLSKALTLSAITLVAAMSGGCKFTGGGVMLSASAVADEKATVSINGKCDGGTTLLELTMQYNEHGSGTFTSDSGSAYQLSQVRFHVNSEIDISPDSCDGTTFPTGAFVGEYCPQPYGQWKNEPNAGCGDVTLIVEDGDLPNGVFNVGEDIVILGLIGGAFSGYTNESIVQGNITSH
jgi:hypothetical protein